MEKKFEFTGETKEVHGHILHRIMALKDFGDVKAGDLGGWIEKKENLRNEFDCWVLDEACVFENALVSGDALVY